MTANINSLAQPGITLCACLSWFDAPTVALTIDSMMSWTCAFSEDSLSISRYLTYPWPLPTFLKADAPRVASFHLFQVRTAVVSAPDLGFSCSHSRCTYVSFISQNHQSEALGFVDICPIHERFLPLFNSWRLGESPARKLDGSISVSVKGCPGVSKSLPSDGVPSLYS